MKSHIDPILLYKTRKGELAVKFSSERIRNLFLAELGEPQQVILDNRFKGSKGTYLSPSVFVEQKTVVYFPAYEDDDGNLKVVFPQNANVMKNVFLEILSVSKPDIFKTTKQNDEISILNGATIFKDHGANIQIDSTPVSAALERRAQEKMQSMTAHTITPISTTMSSSPDLIANQALEILNTELKALKVYIEFEIIKDTDGNFSLEGKRSVNNQGDRGIHEIFKGIFWHDLDAEVTYTPQGMGNAMEQTRIPSHILPHIANNDFTELLKAKAKENIELKNEREKRLREYQERARLEKIKEEKRKKEFDGLINERKNRLAERLAETRDVAEKAANTLNHITQGLYWGLYPTTDGYAVIAYITDENANKDIKSELQKLDIDIQNKLQKLDILDLDITVDIKIQKAEDMHGMYGIHISIEQINHIAKFPVPDISKDKIHSLSALLQNTKSRRDINPLLEKLAKISTDKDIDSDNKIRKIAEMLIQECQNIPGSFGDDVLGKEIRFFLKNELYINLPEQKDEMLEFIIEMPTELDVAVNGRKKNYLIYFYAITNQSNKYFETLENAEQIQRITEEAFINAVSDIINNISLWKKYNPTIFFMSSIPDGAVEMKKILLQKQCPLDEMLQKIQAIANDRLSSEKGLTEKTTEFYQAVSSLSIVRLNDFSRSANLDISIKIPENLPGNWIDKTL